MQIRLANAMMLCCSLLLFCWIISTLLGVSLARPQLSMACLPPVSMGALTAIAGTPSDVHEPCSATLLLHCRIMDGAVRVAWLCASQLLCPCRLNVTAFHCKNCGSTTERRNPECRQHEVQKVTATKRWWQCCHCSNRFTTVAVRLPKTRCPK